MDIKDILLATKKPISSRSSYQNVNQIIQTQDLPEKPIKNISNNSRDYIQELKSKLIKRLVARWLNSKNENKQYFSATEITECPKQTWYKLKGKITKDMIDYNKLFYLLDIYGRMGDTVHKFIYDTLEFESTEKYIKDEKNHLSGRYDIYDNGNIIDIKSSQNITDVSPQLSIYYYLMSKYKGLPVKGVYVWWVLKDKLIEYDIKQMEELYPKYLNRAKMLYEALKLDDYPESLGIDEKSCQYCPIESWCKGKKTIKYQEQNIDSKKILEEKEEKKHQDDIIMLL